MNLLVISLHYPYSDYPSWGLHSERSALALSELCDTVEVLAPRPYVPPLAKFMVPRWRSYSRIFAYTVRKGIPVYRPPYIQVPRLGGVVWADLGAYFSCRETVRNMHRRARFDAIISFDLVASGGLAWRIAKDLGIPACGWAIGSDVRVPAASSYGRALLRAVKNLDVVFYQSHELLEIVAERLGIPSAKMPQTRHVVLPRGIPPPPALPNEQLRNRIRGELGIKSNQVLVLNIGRIVRNKGILELLEAISLATKVNPKIICVLVGSKPAFDETTIVQKELDETPNLREHVRLLPSCDPDKVWEYLCAADVFAFPSHSEGMPNGLLEAMVMGVPTVAFAIPPVLEIEGATACMVTVPPLNAALFSEAILRLAAAPRRWAAMGERGRDRVLQHFMMREKMTEALQRLAQVIKIHVPSLSATNGPLQ